MCTSAGGSIFTGRCQIFAVYGKEEDCSNFAGGVDEKTFRKCFTRLPFLFNLVVSSLRHATDNMGRTDHRRQPIASNNR
eukprot:scaffold442_cov110-Skeletonema_menzelii.AAC.1